MAILALRCWHSGWLVPPGKVNLPAVPRPADPKEDKWKAGLREAAVDLPSFPKPETLKSARARWARKGPCSPLPLGVGGTHTMMSTESGLLGLQGRVDQPAVPRPGESKKGKLKAGLRQIILTSPLGFLRD